MTTETATTPAASENGAVPPRSAVPKQFTWDLEALFPDAAAWEAAYREAEQAIPTISAYEGKMGESAQTFLKTLQMRDEIAGKVERVSEYAFLRFSEDAGNSEAAAMLSRADSLNARAGGATAFVDPEILSIPEETIERFFQEEPALAPYRFAVDRVLAMRPHYRSPEVEAVLAQASELANGPTTIALTLTDSDLPFGTITDEDGKTVQISQGNIERYLASRDARVRREVWRVSADAHLAFADTLAAALQGAIKRDVFYARAHNYETALEASLDAQKIPAEVFHNLIATVRKNYPTWQRFFRVRQKLLGVDELHPGDLHAPLGQHPPKISWDEGIKIITESLAPMGEEYVTITAQGIKDRWVDAMPNQGKGSGAFSGGPYGGHPYISMNWHNDLGSVSTLTHELGHSLHSYHAMRGRPITYWPYSLFTAEVASNFHQALMGKYLLDHYTDREWVLAILEERMANHLRYFFIMPILAQFEYWAHTEIEQGGALTADSMTNKLADLFIEAYGDTVVVSEEDRPRVGITWAQFGHLHMNYYVYQYATGISAAAALAKQVLDGGESVVRRYRNFLSRSGDGYPIDILKEAGVDMSSPAPVEDAFAILAGYVDRLEQRANEQP